MNSTYAFSLFGIIVLATACGSGLEAARDRASREYNCPVKDTHAKWLGSSKIGEVYRVDACGTIATYACDESTEECIKESDDRSSGD